MTRLARLTLTTLAALAASASLAADPRDPLLFPPNPSSRDAIRVGAWNPCPAVYPVVSRDERTVFIELAAHSLTGCNENSKRRVWVDIGVLPPGEWRILITGLLGGGSVTAHVRGIEPYAIYPPGAPATGGGTVRIADAWFGWIGAGETVIERVFFGETEGIVHREPNLAPNLVEAPPHDPGIVDVKVVLRDGRTFVTPHAFKFFEGGSSPDPFVFEPLLFPSAYNGPGAEGSAWRTENVIDPLGLPVVTHGTSCDCIGATTNPTRLEGPSRPDGALLWVARDAEGTVAASSRIHDATRQTGRPGTELPVVRIADFRERVSLTNIPTAATNRVMLRVWGLFESEAIEVWVGSARTTLPLYRSSEGLPFGSLDLTPLVAKLADERLPAVYVDGRPSLVWAMATVTDTETHQVSVLVPSP